MPAAEMPEEVGAVAVPGGTIMDSWPAQTNAEVSSEISFWAAVALLSEAEVRLLRPTGNA